MPDIRALNRTRSSIQAPGEDPVDLARYGYTNFLGDVPIDGLLQRALYESCIRYLQAGQISAVPFLALVQKVMSELTGSEFAFHSITPASGGRFRIEVLTESKDIPVPLQTVSQGTLSLVAIFGLVYEYLVSLADRRSDCVADNASGIVLIDEFDAHLHPAWQRRVLDLLRRTFPNVQFICTAHSPLVIAGCLENEVSVLRRDGDERFRVENISHDFVGWSPERILRRVFEIEERDLSLGRYTAMALQLPELLAELEKLQRKDKKSEEDKKRVQILERDIHYIGKAKEAQQELSEVDLLRDVREMRSRRNSAARPAEGPTPP